MDQLDYQHLSPGQRVTLAAWAQSYAGLVRDPWTHYLAHVAAHALLARLRDCVSLASLLERYNSPAFGADVALVESLLPDRDFAREELPWYALEGGYWLRLAELAGRRKP